MEGALKMSYHEIMKFKTGERITEIRSILEALEESISDESTADIESIYRALGIIYRILSTEPAVNPSTNPKYRS